MVEKRRENVVRNVCFDFCARVNVCLKMLKIVGFCRNECLC